MPSPFPQALSNRQADNGRCELEPVFPLCATQARPARRWVFRRGRADVRRASSPPVSPEGDSSFADPDGEALRPILITRTGPASPARLPVYPLRNGLIVGTGFGGGENFLCRHPRASSGEQGKSVQNQLVAERKQQERLLSRAFALPRMDPRVKPTTERMTLRSTRSRHGTPDRTRNHPDRAMTRHACRQTPQNSTTLPFSIVTRRSMRPASS